MECEQLEQKRSKELELELELENTRLNRLMADQALDDEILKEAV